MSLLTTAEQLARYADRWPRLLEETDQQAREWEARREAAQARYFARMEKERQG